jgi:hypothetical protein
LPVSKSPSAGNEAYDFEVSNLSSFILSIFAGSACDCGSAIVYEVRRSSRKGSRESDAPSKCFGVSQKELGSEKE